MKDDGFHSVLMRGSSREKNRHETMYSKDLTEVLPGKVDVFRKRAHHVAHRVDKRISVNYCSKYKYELDSNMLQGTEEES